MLEDGGWRLGFFISYKMGSEMLYQRSQGSMAEARHDSGNAGKACYFQHVASWLKMTSFLSDAKEGRRNRRAIIFLSRNMT